MNMKWEIGEVEVTCLGLNKTAAARYLPSDVSCLLLPSSHFISLHRVEFGEVSGHRVLIKRGPGNRGASQRGSTHEATSGMSS